MRRSAFYSASSSHYSLFNVNELIEFHSRNFTAVLADDSDYLCLGVPYLSLSSLQVHDDKAFARLFSPAKVLNGSFYPFNLFYSHLLALAIPSHLLPTLACLVGNDYMEEKDLNVYHTKVEIASFVANE